MVFSVFLVVQVATGGYVRLWFLHRHVKIPIVDISFFFNISMSYSAVMFMLGGEFLLCFLISRINVLFTSLSI